jgi:site-specific DNA-cytosine methylase
VLPGLQLRRAPLRRLIADDLFAGRLFGGWDLAAAELGIHARGVENMKEARATRDAAGLTTIHDDVWTFRPTARPTGPHRLPALPDVLARPARAPAARPSTTSCAESVTLHTTSMPCRDVGEEVGDARTALVLTPLHFALTNPGYRWLAWEQVPTVLPVWEACAERCAVDGWNGWTGYLFSEQYGVPQTRKRAFLLASRDHEVAPPTPTHSRYYSRSPEKLDEGVVVPLYGVADGACACPTGAACPSAGKHPHGRGGAGTSSPAAPTSRPGSTTTPATTSASSPAPTPASSSSTSTAPPASPPSPTSPRARPPAPTRIVRTGSGGLHYFFRHPGTSWSTTPPATSPPASTSAARAARSSPRRRSPARAPTRSRPTPTSPRPPTGSSELLHEHTTRLEQGHPAEVKGAEHVDVELLPDGSPPSLRQHVGTDEGRFKHFHAIVAACYEAGYTQGQTVTIAAPWCKPPSASSSAGSSRRSPAAGASSRPSPSARTSGSTASATAPRRMSHGRRRLTPTPRPATSRLPTRVWTLRPRRRLRQSSARCGWYCVERQPGDI